MNLDLSIDRGAMTIGEKLGQISWSLVFLITLVACIGFATLYSAAGGSLEPWALKQMIRFLVGMTIMVGVAVVDLRFWVRHAYLFYGIAIVLLALVEVKGIISSETQASADKIITALREAFDAKHAKGVILRINSPGGSPVQAGYINDEVHRLKAKYKKEKGKDMPVYAVAADLCASGGYYIAVAADKIYADKGSLVGSIGVRLDGFGFQEAMEDLGVERRLLTAGVLVVRSTPSA